MNVVIIIMIIVTEKRERLTCHFPVFSSFGLNMFISTCLFTSFTLDLALVSTLFIKLRCQKHHGRTTFIFSMFRIEQRAILVSRETYHEMKKRANLNAEDC